MVCVRRAGRMRWNPPADQHKDVYVRNKTASAEGVWSNRKRGSFSVYSIFATESP